VLDFACGSGSLRLNGRKQVGKAGGGCSAFATIHTLRPQRQQRLVRQAAEKGILRLPQTRAG